jgi:type IV secretion system protein VirB2
LPWESPFQKIVASLTGPIALGLALIAIFCSGLGLIFGGEMNDFVKSCVKVVFVVSLLVGGAGVLANLFGVSGALI